MLKIICCVYNNKGGVGKTSQTVNLGSAIATQKKRVLIIDNDPQANATSILLKDAAYVLRLKLVDFRSPRLAGIKKLPEVQLSTGSYEKVY